MHAQLGDWWRARAALNDRLADLMYSLNDGCPREDFTAAIEEVTGGAAHPAQTIVGITGLAVPGCLIEIECTASLA